MPRIRVVFNEPIHIAEAAASPSLMLMPTSAKAEDNSSDEDRGLPPPRQLTDPHYPLGFSHFDAAGGRRAVVAAATGELHADGGRRAPRTAMGWRARGRGRERKKRERRGREKKREKILRVCLYRI
uniref:Uncharacterized protein n=1 Tax=Oryza brachyantha TaxID=4533 RepID=J3NDA9_ORYBR